MQFEQWVATKSSVWRQWTQNNIGSKLTATASNHTREERSTAKFLPRGGPKSPTSIASAVCSSKKRDNLEQSIFYPIIYDERRGNGTSKFKLSTRRTWNLAPSTRISKRQRRDSWTFRVHWTLFLLRYFSFVALFF